jgi:FkbM family methyltransferase
VSRATKELVLEVRGGARVCVPADLEKITTYVLLEQEDWFEREIRFVRRVLQPGMRVADIGASFGLYTAAAALAVGPGGRVWAFEPAREPAEHLKLTLDRNGFSHVRLLRRAVSDHAGRVSLRVHPNSELNAITVDRQGSAELVAVPCTTLDQAAADEGWGEIDFVKLDVEGAEAAAVEGGRGLLSVASPLVMFEIKAVDRVDLQVLEPLGKLDYRFYRLLPGILTLVPFDSRQPVDAYQLNLFACKPDRAGALAAAGLLAEDSAGEQDSPDMQAWTAYARSAVYARELATAWPTKAPLLGRRGTRAYFNGLAAYAASLALGAGAGGRHGLLQRAFALVKEAHDAAPTLARRLSYARLAYEVGICAEAVRTLAEVVQRLEDEAAHILEEPFIAPSARSEALPSGPSPLEWLRCAAIEQYERLRAFSSLWTGTTALDLLAPIAASKLRSPEVERRRQLVRMRHGMQRGPEAVPLLAHRSDLNLNPDFWSGRVRWSRA